MEEIKKGPWFRARYDGECSNCDGAFYEGDSIRADGEGTYECETCEYQEIHDEYIATKEPPASIEDFFSGPAPKGDAAADVAPGIKAAALLSLGEPNGDAASDAVDKLVEDFFSDPTPSERNPENDRYDWLGRYAVKDPATGEYRRTKTGKIIGFTRATTFNKAASDKGALGDWNKRNVVIGASLRPDLVVKAHGWTHDGNKDSLNSLVLQLEEAAGSKVSANLGTELHAFTERMDNGEATWQDAPEAWQRQLALYAQTLADAGLEPVRGLVERTTMISEYGGVCGTFDRVMLHRPSGRYLAVDVKTGKTMQYAMQETETQLWTYAHGVNQNGLWDWERKIWTRQYGTADGELPPVSEEVGVVIHMPATGPDVGTVKLLHADLVAGGVHAALCYANRSKPKAKVRAFAPSELSVAPLWDDWFASVQTSEEASVLWRKAKDAGIEGIELNRLVGLAQGALRVRG